MTSIEWLFNELWETPKDKLTWHSILKKAKETENVCSLQTEISDEEIEKARHEAFLKIDERGDFFEMGAKWYREQLKQL